VAARAAARDELDRRVDELHRLAGLCGQAAATWDEDTGRLAVFLVCRDVTEGVDVQVDVRSREDVRLVEHLVITDPDLRAVNSAQAPDRVAPRPGKSSLADGRLTAHLPPVSFHVLTLERTT
jgi:alpha-N-arabinofuranosidase